MVSPLIASITSARSSRMSVSISSIRLLTLLLRSSIRLLTLLLRSSIRLFKSSSRALNPPAMIAVKANPRRSEGAQLERQAFSLCQILELD